MEVCSSKIAGRNRPAPHGHTDRSRPSTSISLVLPAFNEEQVIAQAVCEADDALSALTDDYEILVVDDGCVDKTVEIVAAIAATRPRVKLIRQPRNLGYGAALRRGFDEATKQLVGFTDADCQFDLRELDRLVLLARDYDIVCGYRIDRQDPALRCFYSKVYNHIVRALLGTGVRDCDCALKLFRRDSLAELSITTDGYLVNAELLTQARQLDKSVVEVGVTHRSRAAGTSKVSFGHAVPVFAALLRFWWARVMFPADRATSGDQPSARFWSPTRQAAMFALLLGLSGMLLFANLGYPLIEPDETRYAQIALEMVESGDWIVPTLHGEPYLDKPPLLYWLTASAYRLFGPSPWSARLPSAIAALLTVAATYGLGRRLIGDRAAWIAGLALLLSAGFVMSARFLIMDGLLAFFTTLGLLAAANGLRGQPRALAWWATAGVACGLGVLVKGPIAVVVCVPPILATSWLANRGGLRRQDWIALLLPSVLIAIPWFYLAMGRQPEFAGHFFWKHHIVRFWSAFNHQQPWWFYLPVLALGLFPASLLFPALGYYLFGRGGSHRGYRTSELGFLVASACWTVLFFSLSGCKLPTYVLPAFPMICLALGKMLDDTTGSFSPASFFGRYNARAARLATAVTLFGGIVLGIAAFAVGSPDLVRATTVFALIVPTLLLAVVTWQRRATSLHEPWLVAIVACLMVGTFGFAGVFPDFASWRSRSHNAATLQQQVADEAPIVFFGVQHDAVRLAITTAPIIELTREQLGEFAALMNQHARLVVVTDESAAEEIRDSTTPALTLRPSPRRRGVYEATRNTPPAVRIGTRPLVNAQ